MSAARYAFLVDWLDPNAQIVWKYQLLFYPVDGSVEMYDIKNRRNFLKRCIYPSVTLQQLFVGSTITVYSRQLQIVEFADDFTRQNLEQSREKTFAMIKPDGVQNLGKIMHIISRSGFVVNHLKMVQFTPDQAANFYACHKDQPFFNDLMSFITSGPVVGMELVAGDAVAKWRDLIGPTNSSTAKAQAPNSIRGMFGTDQTVNAVHGSDSDQTAADELNFFFGRSPGISKMCYSGRGSSTLVIVKPHAVQAGVAGVMVDQIQSRYLVTAAELFVLERPNAMEFYEVYKGVVAEYAAMVDQLTSGSFLALEVTDLDGENPVDSVREMCGPPDPEIARVLRPESLRAKFGVDKVKNAVHCTDLEEDGPLEVTYFFDLLQSAK